jgi:hypothetical protein
MMWNGVKVGKVKGGNNQRQKSEDVELELRVDLVLCSKNCALALPRQRCIACCIWMLRVPYTQFACSGALQRCCATSADSVYM